MGFKKIYFIFLYVLTSSVYGEEKIPSFDGYKLDADISKGKTENYVIFVHGSGPQNLNSDFTQISKENQKPNLFFKDISDALVEAGFSTVRYNKRSNQIQKTIGETPEFKNSKIFKDFASNPLKYFVNDLNSVVNWILTKNPKAKIFLLGHSQGCYISLQLANIYPQKIKGIGLIGFSNLTLAMSIFEQTVYRPMNYFTELDKNKNNELDLKEMGVDSPIAKSLIQQLSALDLDKDKKLQLNEFMAGNYSNIVLQDHEAFYQYQIQESKYPRISDIIRRLDMDIMFFQGEWDNQTLPYHTKSIELVNSMVWRKKNLTFNYFPKLGHALDPRSGVDDLQYSRIDRKALNKLVKEFKDRFLK